MTVIKNLPVQQEILGKLLTDHLKAAMAAQTQPVRRVLK